MRGCAMLPRMNTSGAQRRKQLGPIERQCCACVPRCHEPIASRAPRCPQTEKTETSAAVLQDLDLPRHRSPISEKRGSPRAGIDFLQLHLGRCRQEQSTPPVQVLDGGRVPDFLRAEEVLDVVLLAALVQRVWTPISVE